MRFTSLFRPSLSAALCWVACAAASAEPARETLRVADPFVLEHEGRFYLYGTLDGGANRGIPVRVSDDLLHWSIPEEAPDGYALARRDSFGDRGFWAPSVVRQDGRFLMFYTANERIAVAESESAAGPFRQETPRPLDPEMAAIDPHAFIDGDGRAYLFFVRLQRGNRIFVAELDDDLRSLRRDTLREILSAEAGWENSANADWPVVESPSVIKHQEMYYLFYTANDFRNPDYAVGYATATSPLGPWTRHAGNPILHHAGNLPGTGAGGALRLSDGRLMLFHHAHAGPDAVLPRRSAGCRFDFVPADEPDQAPLVRPRESVLLTEETR